MIFLKISDVFSSLNPKQIITVNFTNQKPIQDFVIYFIHQKSSEK